MVLASPNAPKPSMSDSSPSARCVSNKGKTFVVYHKVTDFFCGFRLFVGIGVCHVTARLVARGWFSHKPTLSLWERAIAQGLNLQRAVAATQRRCYAQAAAVSSIASIYACGSSIRAGCSRLLSTKLPMYICINNKYTDRYTCKYTYISTCIHICMFAYIYT